MRKLLAAVIAVLFLGAGMPVVGALAGRLSHEALVDPYLAAQLRDGVRDLTLLVQAENHREAQAAAQDAGLAVGPAIEVAGAVVARGSRDDVLRVRADRRVERLTGDRPIAYDQQTSHVATRGAEAMRAFDAYYLEEQPPAPGTKTTTCRQVKERRAGRTRTVRQCTTTTSPPVPQPPVERTVTLEGATGAGVSIAVVDSGVDGTHPMFMVDGQSRVVRNLRLACLAAFFVDGVPCDAGAGPGDPREDVFIDQTDTYNNSDWAFAGHGTHVASIAAGGSATTAQGRRLHGAAPDAKVIALGMGAHNTIITAGLGLEWVLENHRDPCGGARPLAECPPIKVVNNSWGGDPGAFDPESPNSILSQKLIEAGVVVVFAHGNDGGDGSEINANPEAQHPTPGLLAVASVDDGGTGTRDATVSGFSSRGKKGTFGSYPDVAAPGSDILGACRPYMNPLYGCNSLPLDAVGSRSVEHDPMYGTIGGTSMAAPHVAGIVAQLFEAANRLRFELTPAVVEDILEDTAYKMADGAPYEPDTLNDGTTSFDKGHGLIDAKAALTQLHAIANNRAHYLKDAPPPTQAVPCSGASIATDAEGDATDVPPAAGVGPNEPGLDLRGLSVAAAGDDHVVFAIRVTDLGASNPRTAPNAGWNVYFDHAGASYYAEAVRSASGATSFGFGRSVAIEAQGTGATSRVPTGSTTGTLDPDADTITVVVSSEALEAAGAPPIKAGDVLSGLQAVSRRSATPAASAQGPSADTTDELCVYKVGAGAMLVPTDDTEAAPPADGQLSMGSPTYTWSGSTGPDVVLPFTGTNASGCDGEPTSSGCDVERLGVSVSSPGSTLTIETVTSEEALALVYYLYAPDGTQVAWGEGSVTGAVATSGVYTVVVRSQATVTGAYEAKATLAASDVGPIAVAGEVAMADGGSATIEGTPTAVYAAYSCTELGDPECFTYAVDVSPADGAGTLSVTLLAFEGSDYDFYVYDASGAKVAESVGLFTLEERADLPVAPGRYYVMVQPFLAAPVTPFTLELSLG